MDGEERCTVFINLSKSSRDNVQVEAYNIYKYQGDVIDTGNSDISNTIQGNIINAEIFQQTCTAMNTDVAEIQKRVQDIANVGVISSHVDISLSAQTEKLIRTTSHTDLLERIPLHPLLHQPAIIIANSQVTSIPESVIEQLVLGVEEVQTCMSGMINDAIYTACDNECNTVVFEIPKVWEYCKPGSQEYIILHNNILSKTSSSGKGYFHSGLHSVLFPDITDTSEFHQYIIYSYSFALYIYSLKMQYPQLRLTMSIGCEDEYFQWYFALEFILYTLERIEATKWELCPPPSHDIGVCLCINNDSDVTSLSTRYSITEQKDLLYIPRVSDEKEYQRRVNVHVVSCNMDIDVLTLHDMFAKLSFWHKPVFCIHSTTIFQVHNESLAKIEAMVRNLVRIYDNNIKYIHNIQTNTNMLQLSTPYPFMQPAYYQLRTHDYDTFKSDHTKYEVYSAAILKSLDTQCGGQKSSIKVAVLGCGTGALLDLVYRAAIDRKDVVIEIYGVEHNKFAFPALLQRNAHLWRNKVTFFHQDIRTLQPCEHNRDCIECEHAFPKMDLIVSELQGTFGCNEQAPECLAGVQNQLNPGGLMIPYKLDCYLGFGKHLPSTWQDIHSQPRYTPYTASLAHTLLLGTSKQCFSFPFGEVCPSVQTYQTIFHEKTSHTADVLVGSFYLHMTQADPSIILSTVPETHTKNMQSWFHAFFPFVKPIRSNTSISFTRTSTNQRTYYTYTSSHYTNTSVQNLDGQDFHLSH